MTALSRDTYAGAAAEERVSRLQRALVGALKIELVPLHSPLLGESLLFSFPPLIDMLKFSG